MCSEMSYSSQHLPLWAYPHYLLHHDAAVRFARLFEGAAICYSTNYYVTLQAHLGCEVGSNFSLAAHLTTYISRLFMTEHQANNQNHRPGLRSGAERHD